MCDPADPLWAVVRMWRSAIFAIGRVNGAAFTALALAACVEQHIPETQGQESASIAPSEEKGAICFDAISTPEMAECYGGWVENAEERHAQYLAHAIERHEDQPEVVDQIKASDRAFQTYHEMECDALYDSYGGKGTIRGVARQWCAIERNDSRTMTIWKNWLQYADNTPPDLPKPDPYLG